MSKTIGAHDRQETEGEITQAAAIATKARASFYAIPTLHKPFDGSRLAFEDAATAYDPISALVVSSAARASDCLRQFFGFVNPDEGQFVSSPFAHYALLRPSIEAAATAVWLIQNEKRNERIIRALRLSWHHAGEASQLVQTLGGPKDTGDKVRSRLTALRDQVPALRQLDLAKFPKYSAILSSITIPRPPGDKRPIETPLFLWKLASAFIHGSGHLVRHLSDVRQVTEWSSGVASFEVTPSLRLQAVMAAAATEILVQASRRYLELATTDYASKPVPSPAVARDSRTS